MSDQNGNGEKPTRSLAELAVQRRQEVRRKKYCDAAKLLFDDLTDLCFLNKFSVGFGVVRIGKPLLAERLGCSVPTITRAQRLLYPGEIWTKTGWHEGHEITIWFLRGIADGQLEFDQFTEGVTRSPRTKVAPRVPALRNGHGKFCKASETVSTPDFLENREAPAELTGHNGQSCRGATVNPAVASTAELTGGHRQNRPSGHGRTDRGHTAELTGVNGQNHRNGHGRNGASTTAGLTGYKKDTDTRNGDKGKPAPQNGVKDDFNEALERAFKEWESRLDDMRNSDLRKLEEIASREYHDSQTEEARANGKRKLVAIRLRLRGPSVPDAPAKPKPTRKAPELTEPEILASARQIIADAEKGKIKPLLTDRHRAALRRVGELK